MQLHGGDSECASQALTMSCQSRVRSVRRCLAMIIDRAQRVVHRVRAAHLAVAVHCFIGPLAVVKPRVIVLHASRIGTRGAAVADRH